MRKLTHREIVDRQRKKLNNERLPVTVVLNNIRSLYNVGSVFRSADGAGVEKIWLCGITGYPPNSQISKTAIGAEERVSWDYHKDVRVVIEQLRRENYQIVLLEQMEQSVPYEDFEPRFPVCLVVGNEISGVADELISYCDSAVEIEMAGIKNSLNVAVAFGIISFHLRNCFKKQNYLVWKT